MAEPLYELLAPYFDNTQATLLPRDAQTFQYLNRLNTLSSAEIVSTEPASLQQSAQSYSRNLQALSKRSHHAVINASSHLNNLSTLLPAFCSHARALNHDLPDLESAASCFAEKYDRHATNEVLDRRQRAALLSRNVERVSDVLDLPSLLSSTVSAAQASNMGGSNPVGSAASYASTLDIDAHIKRLRALYSQSKLVADIAAQAEEEMQNLATILVTSLQSQSLKLAGAMRTIGWLRRVAPEMAEEGSNIAETSALTSKELTLSQSSLDNDGALGSLFLVCRLKTLQKTLEALAPLRDLADQETAQREQQRATFATPAEPQKTIPRAFGAQSERYLKRYIEIFREQSFSIISMYKSIFPSNIPVPEGRGETSDLSSKSGKLLPLPSPVSTFSVHLIDILERTLRGYLPNVTDKSVRESLLMQVLYCAGSLGRLGADFGMMVALLSDDLAAPQDNVSDREDDSDEPEWVQVMKKHRVQASRLQMLARGVEPGRKPSMIAQSPPPVSAAPSQVMT